MDHFLIVTNDGKDIDHSVTAKVRRLLEEKGKTCTLCRKDEKKMIIRESIPPELDCAIVIGGDGSLIEVARVLWKRDVPVLGINMGTLGYLTEVEVTHIEEAVTQIAEGRYELENRMMLEGVFEGQKEDVALNDIVVCRKGEPHVIHFGCMSTGRFSIPMRRTGSSSLRLPVLQPITCRPAARSWNPPQN